MGRDVKVEIIHFLIKCGLKLSIHNRDSHVHEVDGGRGCGIGPLHSMPIIHVRLKL